MTRGQAPRNRRSGFTLVEMLVALAVTVVALAVVTVVFNVTTKTATQAAAVSEVESLIRNAMLQLEEDLKQCDPTDSVLVMVGRTQAAARTQDDLTAGRYYRVLTGDPNDVPAGYQPEFDPNVDPPGTNGFPDYSNPRADILMFFSSRPSASQAPPTGTPANFFQQALQDGAKFSPIQVVYGHAAFDDAILSGGSYVFANNLRHIEQDINGGTNSAVQSRIPANRWHLARRGPIIDHDPNDTPFFDDADANEVQRIIRCYGGISSTHAGDAADLNYYGVLGGASTQATRQQSPYVFSNGWPMIRRRAVLGLLYPNANATNHHLATVLETPPANLRSNLGLHALPGCVWFQVEFLMPEDPRNGLDHPDGFQRNDMPRWTEVQAGSTYVFVPDTAANREAVSSWLQPDGTATPGSRLADFALLDPSGPNNVGNRDVRMWPYAIRITVRVFDPKGRLDEPVVRSLVHRFE